MYFTLQKPVQPSSKYQNLSSPPKYMVCAVTFLSTVLPAPIPAHILGRDVWLVDVYVRPLWSIKNEVTDSGSVTGWMVRIVQWFLGWVRGGATKSKCTNGGVRGLIMCALFGSRKSAATSNALTTYHPAKNHHEALMLVKYEIEFG